MVYVIIVLTSLISIWAFYNPEISNKLRFNAYAIKYGKQGYRFFSYALIHAGWVHLLINMFVLHSFGNLVEQVFHIVFGAKGYFFFILLYLGGIIFSVLFDFRAQKENPYYNAVGASGAVSAVVFASILLYPTGKISLLFLPIPIPSFIFGILYLVYSAYMAKRGGDNIGHSAHFWGAVFGILFTIILKPGFAVLFWGQIFG